MNHTADLTAMALSWGFPRRSLGIFAGVVTGLAVVAGGVYAAEGTVAWECSNYSAEAQTRCMQSIIEMQRDRIGKLEGEIQAQQSTVGALQEQVDRQTRATTELQRQLTERPSTVVPAPTPYPYPYAYAYPPGIGFGLYFGRPGVYGGPHFYGRPYWGPRGYRHWRDRW